MTGAIAVPGEGGPRPLQPHEAKGIVRLAAKDAAPIGRDMAPQDAAYMQALGKHITEGQGRKALTEMAGRTEKFDRPEWRKTLEHLIPNPADRAQAEKDTEVYLALIDPQKGFDKMADDPPGPRPPGRSAVQKQAWLLGQVSDHLMADPYTREALVDSTGKISSFTLINQLKDPNVRNAIIRRLNEMYDPTKIPSEENVLNAKNAFDLLDTEVTELKKQETDAGDRLVDHERAKQKFDNDMYSGTATKKDILADLETFPEVQKFILASDILDKARKGGSVIQANAAQAEVTKLMSGSGGADIAEYMKLSNEKKAFEEGITKESGDLKALALTIKAKEGERDIKKREFDRLDIPRGAAGESVKNSLADLVGENAREQVFVAVKEYVESHTEYASKLDAEIRKNADKKLEQFYNTRYLKSERRGLFLQKKLVPDKQQADADLNLLLKWVDAGVKSGGAFDIKQGFVRDILGTAGFSSAEMGQLLADEGFVKAQFAAIAEKAFAAHKGADLSLIDKRNPIRSIVDRRLQSRMKNFFAVHPDGKAISVDIINKNPDAKAIIEQKTGEPVSQDTVAKLEKKYKGAGMLALLLAMGLSQAFQEITSLEQTRAA